MIKANGYFYTDIAATVAEETAMQNARRTPMIVVGGWVPPGFAETMHAYALRHGLPEIQGHYGYDFAEHRFIRLADADRGKPDVWPSRRLADILARADVLSGANS